MVSKLVDCGALVLPERQDGEADDAYAQRLSDLPQLDTLLESIDELVWDGGAFADVAPEWDGEDDRFDIRSLDGVESLTRLRCLAFRGGNAVSDYRPLTRLKRLETVELDGGEIPDIGVFAKVPGLRTLRIRNIQGRFAPKTLKVIAGLRSEGIAVDWTSPDAGRQLLDAVRSGDRKLIDVMLGSGIDVNATADGYAALHIAAAHDDAKLVALLASHGAQHDARDPQGGTALHVAAAHDARKAAGALLAMGADRVAKDQYGATPLHYARKAVLTALIEAGAPLDEQDVRDQTAIVCAAKRALATRVPFLEMAGTVNGAPATFRIRHGEFWIEQDGTERVVRGAAERRAVSEIAEALVPVDDALTAMRVILNGQQPAARQDGIHQHLEHLEVIEVVRKIARAGARLDLADNNGQTMLHYAGEIGEPTLILELIRKRADPARVNADGESLIHAIAKSGRKSAVEILPRLPRKVDVGALDAFGWSATHHGALHGAVDFVVKLPRFLEHVTIKSTRARGRFPAGCTPADCAQIAGHAQLAETLYAQQRVLDAAVSAKPEAQMRQRAVATRTATPRVFLSAPNQVRAVMAQGYFEVTLNNGVPWLAHFVSAPVGQDTVYDQAVGAAEVGPLDDPKHQEISELLQPIVDRRVDVLEHRLRTGALVLKVLRDFHDSETFCWDGTFVLGGLGIPDDQARYLLRERMFALAEFNQPFGEHIDGANALGFTRLGYAIKQRDVARIDRLLRSGASPGAPTHGTVPMLLAMADGGVGLDQLLKANANTEVATPDGWTPLMFAAIDRNRMPALAMLIKAGAKVNARNKLGETALHNAAERNLTEVADVLLRAGCDPALRTYDGKTAADAARAAGYQDMAARLEVAVSPNS